ncbi:hypothetical protein FHS21_001367 [Phyllobacterium trifolii]|uniref:Uncharacterized protein n=1 Tax=Phyllobacterium trifolii TaxID=300193 RepID=A0A839U1W8_9HYPH|nr:hypothetical protein [Phyllobacterium trifolii]MBB3144966.1 hypothetical protein [Phyllobacterium trifolii]
MAHSITWKKTVIGGETAAGDFVAEAAGLTIGRVRKFGDGPQKGKWEWSFLLGHSDFRRGDFSGVEDEKQEAADKIKTAFARYLKYPSDKGGALGLAPDRWQSGLNAYAKAKGG